MKCIKPSSPYVLFLGGLLIVSALGIFFENTEETVTSVSNVETGYYMASNQLINNK